MSDQERDDSPSSFRLSRRRVLIAGGLVAGSAAIGGISAYAAHGEQGEQGDFAARFMEVSLLLIQHKLDPIVGARMAQAMLASDSSLSERVTEIIRVAKTKNAKAVEDFFPDLPEGPLKSTALDIISGWYLGVIKDTADAEVFAFEDALIYKPTSDVMTIPSYAKSKPNGWGPDAPPLSNMPEF
jgi:hypothetical protein